MRDTAVFFRAWFEAAADLPPADFKELFLALADHAFNGADPEAFNLLGSDLAPVAKAILTLAKPVMRKNAEKWEAKQAEAGRPPLEISAEDVQKAVQKCGTMKGAAAYLGVSVRTLYNRLSVQKCRNAKNVNVNVNVNANALHTCKNAEMQVRKDAAKAQGQAFKELALTPSPPSDKELAQAAAIFDKLPFRNSRERAAASE